jgi:hypothetical protein
MAAVSGVSKLRDLTRYRGTDISPRRLVVWAPVTGKNDGCILSEKCEFSMQKYT